LTSRVRPDGRVHSGVPDAFAPVQGKRACRLDATAGEAVSIDVQSVLRGSVMALAIASSAGSCGGSSASPAVTLTGKSPSEAAQDAATAICDRNARCGIVDISCTGGTDAATQCSASIDHPDTASCVAQEQASLDKLLSCTALTASERDSVQQCVDALVAQPCVSQAEADALAMLAQEGMALPPDLPPTACAPLEQPIPGCQ